MLFRHPVENVSFEIPDEWWISAGAHNFYPSHPGYAAKDYFKVPTMFIPVSDVQAPTQYSSVICLHRSQTVDLLRAFIEGIEVPPIEVYRQTSAERFVVQEGFHRYYVSIALGFQMLPVAEKKFFRLDSHLSRSKRHNDSGMSE
jgi:hypothetical protein